MLRTVFLHRIDTVGVLLFDVFLESNRNFAFLVMVMKCPLMNSVSIFVPKLLQKQTLNFMKIAVILPKSVIV